MPSMREWLFKTVAYELTLKGPHGINLKQLANAGGMSSEQMRSLYPDLRALLTALVKEIAEVQKEYILSGIHTEDTPQDRLVAFLMRNLDFVERNPSLAHVIELALLGSDNDLKERVFDIYTRLFGQFADDMVTEGIIPNRNFGILSDLTEILLSVIFLGGCPRLQMDYLSYVDPRKMAVSTLNAIRKNYAAERY